MNTFRLVVALGVVCLAGCARTPPPAPPELPPPVVYEPSPPPELEEIHLEGEVRDLLEQGDLAGAEALVRHALAAGTEDASEARLKVLLGEVLEAQGRTSAAIVHYCSVAGAEGAREELPTAWDGIARIRLAEGDTIGATHATLAAWEASDAAGRRERRTSVEHLVEQLPDENLEALARLSAGDPSQELLAAEIRRRGLVVDGAEVFVVTVLAPLTGRFENFGGAFLLGAQIALEDRDAARADSSGAFDALEIRLRTRDTEGDLLAATREARAAILQDGSRALLGPLLSVTSIGAGAVAEAFSVPLLAPTATDPQVERVGRHVLTLEPAARELTEPLAEFSVTVLGNQRHGVLVARDGFSGEYEREFRDAIESFGGRVVTSISFDPGERDFRRLIERFDAADVDAVYIPGRAADLEALAPQLEFYEFGRRILGNGGWTNPRVLDEANLALEGAIFAVPDSEHPGSEFRLRLRDMVWRRSGVETSQFHVRGYVAMAALLGALDQGARDSEEIVEMLRRRDHWDERPPGEDIHVLTFRDGVLGPASWASGFDLRERYRGAGDEEDAGTDLGDLDSTE